MYLNKTWMQIMICLTFSGPLDLIDGELKVIRTRTYEYTVYILSFIGYMEVKYTLNLQKIVLQNQWRNMFLWYKSYYLYALQMSKNVIAANTKEDVRQALFFR